MLIYMCHKLDESVTHCISCHEDNNDGYPMLEYDVNDVTLAMGCWAADALLMDYY